MVKNYATNDGWGYANKEDGIKACQKAKVSIVKWYQRTSDNRWVGTPRAETKSGDSGTSGSSSTKGKDDKSNESSKSEPKTYIEELQAIADKKNIMWHINCDGELVVKSFNPPTYDKADFKLPDWNIEKDSFKYAVNAKKFPSGIQIKYKGGGTITVKSEQLFGIKGQGGLRKVVKDKLTKTKAEEEAKKMLYEALRDLDIEISFTCLLDYRIKAMIWIGVINPKTGFKEVYLVRNVDTELDPSKIFKMNVSCFFLPKPNESKGGNGKSGDLKDIQTIGQQASKFGYTGCSTASCMDKGGAGDCWAMSEWLYNKLVAAGFDARILQYPTSQSARHRTVQYWDNGWKGFPYKSTGIKTIFSATSGEKNGSVLKSSRK